MAPEPPAAELESAGAWPAATGASGSAGQHHAGQARRGPGCVRARRHCCCQRPPTRRWACGSRAKPALQRHPLFLEGKVEVQDEGSQLLAYLVAPRRREMVVDFCAGAGGKTLALGALMHSEGRVYAFDTAEKRLVQPETATEALGTVQRAPTADRERSRCASEAADVKNRPRAGGRALQRAGNTAPQSRPQVAPGTAGRDRDGGKAARHSRRGGAAGQTGRTAGVRHLQPAAGGKRSHRRRVSRQRIRGFTSRSTAARSSAARASQLDTGTYFRVFPHAHGMDAFFAGVLERAQEAHRREFRCVCPCRLPGAVSCGCGSRRTQPRCSRRGKSKRR